MECKRVLFICSSLNFGGAQKVVSNITSTLPDEYEIDILLNSSDDIQFAYRGNIISLGLHEPKSRESLVYQIRVFLRRLSRIRQLKNEKKYHAIVSILTSANVVNILSRSSDTKCIITEVALQREYTSIKGKLLLGSLIKMFYNRADSIVAETSLIMDGLVEDHNIDRDRITIIPNSVDVEKIHQESDAGMSNEESALYNREFTVITAGRLSQQKGQWHLIRAFSRVKEEVNEAKLVIFGEGELRDTLQNLITSYGLSDSVFLKGFSSQIDRYIANSAAFVFPSLHEGMPTILLQALATGTPCIVTDFYSGAREVLGDEDTPKDHIEDILYTKWGIMVPLCSGVIKGPDEELEREEIILADAIISILKSAELRDEYRSSAYERSKYFDNSAVIDRWIEVIG